MVVIIIIIIIIIVIVIVIVIVIIIAVVVNIDITDWIEHCFNGLSIFEVSIDDRSNFIRLDSAIPNLVRWNDYDRTIATLSKTTAARHLYVDDGL